MPAPPMLILFGAAAATLGARRRHAKGKAKVEKAA
ncbi:PEP-CTERM sorting domain-containing protein [Novosphingobium sp. MW5]|nr:PEP-CTERM sorting domain-containing protein [Novosphingobium sp. MW5]